MKKKTTKKFNARTYLHIALGGLLVILALIGFYLLAPVSSADETRYLYIDSDDTQDSVIVKMEALGHGYGLTGLRIMMRHSSYADNIRTGRYAIEPSEGAVVVFHHLKNGQQTPLRLVIPESRTMDRLASVLSRKLMLDSATFVNTLRDSATLNRLEYDTCTISALFVPNSYEVYWDVSCNDLLERMKREHDRFWQGDRQAKAQQLNMSPVEVCTLASIIDEETSNNAEKPMIAGMYLNRLQQRMPLQADPTIKFALRQFELRRIYNKLLTIDSPYNTYRYKGLPPGPIKIASIQGIDAVLNPVSHDYLYMCAKEDFSGTHNFARTYQEHLKNAARYSQALNARGIK